MSTASSPKEPKSPAPIPSAGEPLFEAFPEPRTYPKHWDGTALHALTTAWQAQPKSKPQA